MIKNTPPFVFIPHKKRGGYTLNTAGNNIINQCKGAPVFSLLVRKPAIKADFERMKMLPLSLFHHTIQVGTFREKASL
ncbi:MAG: hypothetical protein QM654_04375 [Dysgonamonadaceae bacterium]